MKILILDGGLQGLSCGASLYQKHQVTLIASDINSTKSSFFDKVYTDILPDNESLYKFLEREKYDVLIPVSDRTASFISKNKVQIERNYGVKCAVPDYEQICQVENKSRFMEFCESNSIPHPKTIPLTDEMFEKAGSYVGFPALIKPDFSVGARGITRVNSIDELNEHYPKVHSQFGECTLQELIENEEYYYNVMLYRDKNGNFPAYTISKIIRMYPVHAGSSSCLITIENDELLLICKDCLDKLNWFGMADFDVLQRLDNGDYKIIEINPRVPASLRAAAISGVNFPEVIAQDTLGNAIPTQDYYPGKMLRYLGIDLLWLLKSSNRFKTDPGWFKLFGKNVYYQDIFKEDVSTWWTWLTSGLKKLRNRHKKMR